MKKKRILFASESEVMCYTDGVDLNNIIPSSSSSNALYF
jgi:hypothetical protein